MKVLFVCTGNTCRSPMAEGYLKEAKIPDLSVESRGLCADKSPVSENSKKAMAEIDIDISSHISSPITAEDLSADKIYCMSDSHRAALLSVGVPTERVFVLGEGIPDPYGGELTVYRFCRDQIIKEIDALLNEGEFMPFKITSADSSHIAKIAALEQKCFSEPWSEQAILDSLRAGTKFFCAVKENRLLGYVGISTVLDEGYIANIAVDLEYRHKGVASLLIRRIFELARDHALSFVSLEVRRSNQAAIALYEKFGFREEGVRKNFYREPTEDAIIMTRRFPVL